MPKKSDERQLVLALRAMEENQKLSVREAARIYSVSRTTLSCRRRGRHSRSDAPANSRKLTDLEESTIIQYILDLDSRSFPPRVRHVEDMANRLLDARGATRVGSNWISRFITRHPELKTRFFRRYDYQRAQCEDSDVIRGWFELVRNTVAKYGIQEADMFNFDETGFMMGIISAGMVVTSAERRGRPKMTQPGGREWVTVIQGVNSQGWAIPPYIIVAGKHHLSAWYENYNIPRDWVIAVSSNGWTTNERGLDWVRHFDHHTKHRCNGSHRLLILDGHDSHHSIDFELYCKENKIITLCMPAHSSHILQPLDVGCFGPLKKAYGREIEDMMRARITHVTKTDFLPAFHAAHLATMDERNIRGGFRGAGLVPFNPDSVISRLDVKLRTPTPPAEPPDQTLPWVSKTPNNPIEATSQTDYVKRRIANHQNSSPTSIYAAIDQVAKGTKGVMHQVALLTAEVEQLRAANAALSKRRRAKKSRIREGGSLTLQQGQQLQRRRGDRQREMQEMHQRRASSRRSAPKERHCSACGEQGHDSRTCEIVVKLSEEEGSE